MPQTKITVINDLQMLDEALFRLSVATFVAGVQVDRFGMPDMTFDFPVNPTRTTSIPLVTLEHCPCEAMGDYSQGTGAPSKRFKSDRLGTTIDLESFPCCVSFSEQSK